MFFYLYSVFCQIILNVKHGLLFTSVTEITKITSADFTFHLCHYKVIRSDEFTEGQFTEG